MRIVVYGATGYTGKLVAAEVRRRGFELVMAGRSRQRLREAAIAVGVSDAEQREAGIGDPSALRSTFQDCDAVINCAGPFTFFGEPVVRAAIEAGTHYVDTTGEQLYTKHIFDTYSQAAAQARVTVVPSMGYDILPGSFIAQLTGERVEPVDRLTVAYTTTAFDMTRGTMHSVLEMFKGNDLRYTDGDWRPAGLRTRRPAVRFPGRKRNSPTLKFPGGEVATVPRHVQAKNVDVVMDASSLVPIRPLAAIVPSLGPALALLLRTPLRAGLDRLIQRLPEGPTEDRRKKSTFSVTAHAVGSDGREAQGAVSGRDIYGSTAVICVEGVRRLHMVGADHGVLAPAQAFDPYDFLQFLAAYGFEWSVQSSE